MQQILTKDGSITFHNEKYGESYHSVSGAIEESFKKFAEPCCVKDRMRILDICFGIGYNSLAAVHMSKDLEIVGLENDKKILEKIKDVKVSDELKEDYEIIKKAAESGYDDGKLKIKIIAGDARNTIKEVDGEFDAVFLDPFSPKKCPELWTLEFFIEIKKKIKKGGILATYSCARIARDNLKKAGFEVKDGPVVGRKAPGTLALNL